MKYVIQALPIVLMLGSFGAQANCFTASAGYIFNDVDQQTTLQDCYQNPYTNNSECDQNLSCDNEGPPPPGFGPGPGNGGTGNSGWGPAPGSSGGPGQAAGEQHPNPLGR
jgi:hypothetical protein